LYAGQLSCISGRHSPAGTVNPEFHKLKIAFVFPLTVLIWR
jgi:hypothetical protein